MGKLIVIGGFMLGAAVGAVVVMCFTPVTGKTVQERLRERYEEIMEEGRRAAAERRAELESQFAEYKRPPRPVGTTM